MSLTYSEIQTMVDAGNTASEIAAALTAITRHKRDCWATKSGADNANPDFLFLLSARYDAIDELNVTINGLPQSELNDALKVGWKRLERNLAVTDRKVLANSDMTGQTGELITEIAGTLGQIVEARGQGITQAEVVADVYTLTGGPLYAGVTAEQVQATIDAHNKQTKLDGWKERFSAAINQFGTSEQADGVTDLRAIADEMEAA